MQRILVVRGGERYFETVDSEPCRVEPSGSNTLAGQECVG